MARRKETLLKAEPLAPLTRATSKKSPAKAKAAPKKSAATAIKKVPAPQMDDLRQLAHLSAVLVIDADEFVVFASQPAAQALGKSAEELVGLPAPVGLQPGRPIEWRKTSCRVVELTVDRAELSETVPEAAAEFEARLREAQRQATELKDQLHEAQRRAAEHDERFREALSQAARLDDRLQSAESQASQLGEKLRDAECQTAELQDRLREAESEAAELKDQAPDGRVAELEAQLTEAHARLVRATQLEWQLEVAQARAEDLDQELGALRGRLEEFEARPTEDLTRELVDTRGALQEAQNRAGELEQMLANTQKLQDEYQRFESEARAAEERTSELERRLPQVLARADELESDLTTTRALNARLEMRVSSAEARVEELKAQFEEAGGRCEQLETQLQEARAEARAEVRGEDLLAQAQGRIGVLEGLLAEATTQLEQAHNEPRTADLEYQLRHALARADDLEARLQSTPIREGSLAQMVKLGELEAQLTSAHAELSRALELEQAATARAHALEALLAEAQIGRVPTVAAEPVHSDGGDAPLPGLLYEPIFELVSGKLAGVEATPCWDDPEHGLIRVPGDSLAVTTGYQMLIEVCQLAAAWQAEGFSFFTALDTGQALLRHPELPGILREALRLGNLPAEMVVLEIPGLAQSEDGRLEQVLAQLAQDGVGLAVEGLGMGTTSFTHLSLSRLVKLDSRLVAALPQQPWAVQAAKAALGLARGQGVRSVAVGIESEPQYRWLRNAQCELGQGSHLSPPVTPEQIMEFARWGRLV